MFKHESSFGIIPLKEKKNGWWVFFVYHSKGFWAFPKGHAEPEEDGKEAAIRELKEETGLSIVRFLNLPPFKEHYYFQHEADLIHKHVIYWAAEVRGRIKLQAAEIAASKWVPIHNAVDWATYPESKGICCELQKVLADQ